MLPENQHILQKSVKMKPKGSILRKKYGSWGWNKISFKSHNSTSTCRSEKRFYFQSNSLSDNISLTLKLKFYLTQFGDVSPCDVIIWLFGSNKNLKLPGQQSKVLTYTNMYGRLFVSFRLNIPFGFFPRLCFSDILFYITFLIFFM